jgi:PAS domain S-box-containing protein
VSNDKHPPADETPTLVGDFFFRHLVESLRDYAIIMLSPAGLIEYWNAGAQQLKGYAPDEAVGRHFSMLYTAAAIEAGWPDEELRRAASSGRFEDEGWRRRKDGSLFWANVIIHARYGADGKLIGFSKITRDLSVRRRYEQQLQDSEQNLRLMIEGVKDHAIFYVDESGRIASWNAGAQRLLGYRSEEAVGLDTSVLYADSDRAASAPEADLATARQVGFVQTTGWRLKSDGTRLWTDVTISSLKNDDETLRGFVEVVQDLTERRRIQALEVESRRIHEFIAMLSHELRNPLAPISNSVYVLQRTVSDAPARELIDVIGRQTALLSRLVDDLLDASRIGSGKIQVHLQATDMTAIVMAAVDSLRPSVQDKDHALRIDLEGNPITVPGDSVRLTQVVVNLLSNAIKYTPPGGRISVRLACLHNSAVLKVADSGPGMSAELKQTVFEPFVQGPRDPDRVDSGLGLGLTLVKRVVELHGGSVSILSRPGLGSTFTVALPLSPAAQVPVPTAPEPPRPPPARSTKVLMVDDNRDAAASLAVYLGMLGHQVRVAHSGHEALRLAHAELPDVALLDLGLPGMDGFEIARQIRSTPALSGVRLIALTGYGQDGDREASAHAGFVGHLVKPVDLEQLAQIVAAQSPPAAHKE